MEEAQLSLFDLFDDEISDEETEKKYRYLPCWIEDVHLEEMEEIDESDTN